MKETPGTETSKYRKEEKEKSILRVAASERGRAQTRLRSGVADHQKALDRQEKDLERSTEGGNSPVSETERRAGWHQSSTEHEEFGVKLRGPPRKAKYYLVTDREVVP